MRELTVRERISDYVSLTKPRIMILSLLTVLGGMSVAAKDGWPAFSVVMATLAGVAMAVGAGGTLNNFIERHRDGLMTRTAQRPLPSGRMKSAEALIFGTLLWIGSYFVLYFGVNPPTAFLTMLAFGSYVGIYTPLKTRTSLCTLVGAVPGALPPLIGWTAVRGHVEIPGVVLFLLMFVWQIPHFLALAILRRDEYARAGMPMVPVVYGTRAALVRILLYSLVLWPISLLPYTVLQAGPVYLGLALILGGIAVYLAAKGFAVEEHDMRRWCRTFFFYTIIYLTVLFSALVAGL